MRKRRELRLNSGSWKMLTLTARTSSLAEVDLTTICATNVKKNLTYSSLVTGITKTVCYET